MKVIVQQDGARPHTGQYAVKKMNAIGARLTPAITAITQPAQSPDFNVNDLAFFRALDVRVRKPRRGKGNSFDKDVLVCDEEAAHAEFPSETIERMFAYKEKVMDVVLKPPCDGGNDYERHICTVQWCLVLRPFCREKLMC